MPNHVHESAWIARFVLRLLTVASAVTVREAIAAGSERLPTEKHLEPETSADVYAQAFLKKK